MSDATRERLALMLVAAAAALSACGGHDGTPSDPGGGARDDGGGTPQGEREFARLLEARLPSDLKLHDGHLYWREGGSGAIHRMSLGDGSDAALFSPLPHPKALVADTDNVFWSAGGVLFRSALDGSRHDVLDSANTATLASLALDDDNVYSIAACSPPCTSTLRRVPKSGGPATTLLSAGQEIIAFAVFGGHVFWEERGIGPVQLDGSTGSALKRMSLADGTVTVLVNGRLNGLMPPPLDGHLPGSWLPTGGIAVDDAHVYFSDTHRVLSVSAAGGDVAVLASVPGYDDYVHDLEVEGATVYWTDGVAVRATPKAGGSTSDVAPGPVSSMAVAGGSLFWVETACCAHGQKGRIRKMATAPHGVPVTLEESADAPDSIAADAARAYWIEGGAIGAIEGFGSISWITHDGSAKGILFESGGGGPFDVHGDHVYFAHGFTLKKVPASGGPVTRLGIASFYVTGVATDGADIYFVVNEPIAIVQKMPVGGGPMLTLGTSDGPARRVVLDATHVYWMAHEDSVARVSKSGGEVSLPVNAVPGLITDFAVCGADVCYAEWDGGRIRKAPVEGGAPTTLATCSPDQTRTLAVDGEIVYWIDQLAIERVPTTGGAAELLVSGVACHPFLACSIATDATTLYFAETGSGDIWATPK